MKKKYGVETHPLYLTWSSMKTRCYNPNHWAYSKYGGRGITVCSRWRKSFLKFVSDMGERPSGTTLDRIDNSKGYRPSNCRWATKQEQARNRRKNANRISIVIRGKRLGLREAAQSLGIPFTSAYREYKRADNLDRYVSI